jgi:hypothetical protein
MKLKKKTLNTLMMKKMMKKKKKKFKKIFILQLMVMIFKVELEMLLN